MSRTADLTGRTVLVTGASSGIGWACAEAFAAAGCRVALAARRVEKAGDLARSLRARGAEAMALACDVRDAGAARAAVERTAGEWGRIDYLINNAGVQETKPFEDQDLATVEDILRTNLLGCIYTMHAAIPLMRRAGEGHIVNVASIAGLIGLPYMAVYCASKFALVGLTEALRRELRGTGVTLTAFCPGTVDTPMVAESLSDPGLSKLVRPKTAAQIAAAVVEAARRRSPEVVIGEVPGALLKAARFVPRLTDAAAATIVARFHPLARRYRAGK